MTRTARYKLIYFAILAGGVLLGLAVTLLLSRTSSFFPVVLIGVCLLLLVPGRIQGYFWSDLQAGLYHLNRKHYAASKAHSERFLVTLRKRPWLRQLIWLGTSAYSRNVEVLARNNLGAAMMKLGEIDAAKEQLTRAIALDPECPLPYRNMGVLTLHSATSAEAMPWFEKAAALGLTDGWSDRVVRASQDRHAARSTTDKSADAETLNDTLPPTINGPFLIEILNNDETPLEFVVACLEETFGLTGIQAIRIARAVDERGSAPCAGFETEEAAQAKAGELRSLANRSGTPFACQVRRA